MPVIIPRWEWRTFGSRFGLAETRFAALTPTGVQESDELYLARRRRRQRQGPRRPDGHQGPARDRRRRPRAVGAGDEGRLPARRGGRRRRCSMRSACRRPALARERLHARRSSSPSSSRRRAGLRAVKVHKRRVRYTVGGCTSEVSDVDGRRRRRRGRSRSSPRTRPRSSRPSRSVGLGGYRQHELPGRACARLLDGTAGALRGASTSGTNSVKFHVGERVAGRALARGRRPRRDDAPRRGPRARPARSRAEALDAHGERDRRHGRRGEARARRARASSPSGPPACGSPRNGDDVVAADPRRGPASRSRSIPGEEESRLAYLAVKAGLGLAEGSLVVFDTGGGSTQFTFGHGDRVDERFSVEVGAVRLHGAVRPRRRRVARGARRGAGGDRGGPRRGSTAAAARTRSSAWAARSRTSRR